MNIIKLQPDQISLFWTLIRHGVIQAYKIPRDYQQDFAIKYLENLMLGLYQCWIGYTIENEEKRMTAVLCTRIVDEKEQGVRTLAMIGVYGIRLIPQEMYGLLDERLEEFARANGCSAIVTEYRIKRVGEMLREMGYEEHITMVRKVLD